jgi:peroxiredoxin
MNFIARVLAVVVTMAVSNGVLSETAWAMGERPPVVGTAAADFSLTDLGGKVHRLSDYRGKIVLLNFWATWCKPCTTEMPAMQVTYDRLREQGFIVLAVNELEDESKVREHIRTHAHTFPVLLDRDNRVANMYGVFGLPVSVFVDPQGIVQEYVKGGLLTEQRIADMVGRIKGQAGPRVAVAR